MFRFFLLAFLIAFPHTLLAAVSINEVAWMGSVDSANDEWIELYNDGGDVSVDGWTLSDGAALLITLSGTIPGGSYAVLERTDDDSAPGTAFLVYTGALGNDGRTLTLTRVNGSLEDQVVGGSDWQNIGGDNTTKETAQYTTSGWITALATPGARNANSGSVHNEDSSDDVNSSNTAKDDVGKNEYISLVEPDNELQLTITAPHTGYVNQPVTMSVEPSGLGARIMDSLTYTWNFGNLSIGTGREIQTRYNHPGTYVVVVEATYGKYVARARHTLTIVPTTVSLMKNRAGDILIQNHAQYEADMSGFTLKGDTSVVFPPYTFLAPKATMVVPAEKVTDSHVSMVALYDNGKDMIASTLASLLPIGDELEYVAKSNVITTPTVQASTKPPQTSVETMREDAPVGEISATRTTKVTKDIATRSDEANASSDLAAASTAGIPNEKLPYLGLIGLIVIGIIGLYSGTHKE